MLSTKAFTEMGYTLKDNDSIVDGKVSICWWRTQEDPLPTRPLLSIDVNDGEGDTKTMCVVDYLNSKYYQTHKNWRPTMSVWYK